MIQWLQTHFGGVWRSGLLTEDKQVGNRVSEQFRYQSDNVAFVDVATDPVYDTLDKNIRRYAYPQLKNVLVFRRVGNDFQLKLWLRWGAAPSSNELAVFPGATWTAMPTVAAPAGATTGPQPPPTTDPDVAVNWSAGENISTDPSGLVGALGPFRQAVAALRADKNVILMGPPGTGKTELAVAICNILEVQRDIVTATSDWTTFDTIGGYLPDPAAAQGGGPEPLNFSPGCVTRSLEGKRWMVIDELNRADIDKAFGELFTMLSDQIVRLPFKRRRVGGGVGDVVLGDAEHDSDEPIRVPEGWRIIGTMNTFDKASLYQMSFAFMRRFAFLDVDTPDQPAYAALLTAKAQPLASARNDAFRDECIPSLTALFCPLPTTAAPTLTSLGLVVGPAIPLDIISYVESRAKLDTAADAKTILREAVEMYLLPQFEGQDKKHKKIVEAIKNALGLDPTGEQSIERRLRTWTGFEPRKTNA